MEGDDVLLLLLERYAPLWLAGLLGAGIMAAVMASDSQILALSTMFTEDVFALYGGKERFGEAVQVQTGRAFVVIVTVVAYAIAMVSAESIFDVAMQYAFSGFAALAPLLVAALFWRRSTKWGALAVTLWVAAAVAAIGAVPEPRPGAASRPAERGLANRRVRRGRAHRWRDRRLRPAAGGADGARIGGPDDRRLSPHDAAGRGRPCAAISRTRTERGIQSAALTRIADA